LVTDIVAGEPGRKGWREMRTIIGSMMGEDESGCEADGWAP
jgi:hypothetical protein